MTDKILQALDQRIAELQAKVCEDRPEARKTAGLIEVFATLRAMISAEEPSSAHPSLSGVELIPKVRCLEGQSPTHASPKRFQ